MRRLQRLAAGRHLVEHQQADVGHHGALVVLGVADRLAHADGLGAVVEIGSWPVPPLFRLIEELTPTMAVDERYRTVNMGIGMVVICAPNDAPWISDLIDEPTWRIGTVVDGPREVTLIG